MTTIEKINGTAIAMETGYIYSTYERFAKEAGHPDAVGHGKYFIPGTKVTLLAKGKHHDHDVTIYVISDGERKYLIEEGGLKDIKVTSKSKKGFTNGEKARLKTTNGALGGFKVGEIVTVNTKYDGPSDFEVFNGEVHGYTDASNLEKLTTFKVGDHVRIVDRKYGHRFEIGEIVKLTEKRGDYSFRAYLLDDSDFWSVSVDEIEAVEELTVGDYAKVVGGKTPIQKLRKGDIVKIVSKASAYDFRVKRLTDGETELFDKEDLIAYDGPVFELSEMVEPEAPFKVGDLVKLTIPEGKMAAHGWGSVKRGDVGTVVRIRDNGSLVVDFPNQNDWWGEADEFTLVDDKTAKLADLKAQLADATKTVKDIQGRIERLESDDDLFTYPEHPVRHKTFGDLRKQSQQEIRDEAIEAAKRDIEVMEAQGGYDAICVGEGNRTYQYSIYKVKYVINQDKRTVVALVYSDSRYNKGELLEKGVAKCAPDDCFNAHIGKAIALKRAFGLDIPEQYRNAPLPTEVRVGDIIESTYSGTNRKYQRTIAKIEDGYYRYVSGGFDRVDNPKIHTIDDSRLEVE